MSRNQERPIALLTNDDGINSEFMWAQSRALQTYFDVYVVAPDDERSWAGRAFSRYESLHPQRVEKHANAWALNGTPTDCVNLGIHNLLPRRPSIVVSGINLGFNMSLPLVLTSGTVSAALEGALSGIHSIATSMHIPPAVFDDVRGSKGRVEGDLLNALNKAAEMTADYAHQLWTQPITGTVVHNLNYPSKATTQSELLSAKLSNLRLNGLYAETERDTFQFRFPDSAERRFVDETTDLGLLEQGRASVTLLNFDRLG